MINRACEICEFSSKVDNSAAKCRRRAPAPQANGTANWPTVQNTDWCGDFRRDDIKSRARAAGE